eukprot:662473-Amphidinium_carterae.1
MNQTSAGLLSRMIEELSNNLGPSGANYSGRGRCQARGKDSFARFERILRTGLRRGSACRREVLHGQLCPLMPDVTH